MAKSSHTRRVRFCFCGPGLAALTSVLAPYSCVRCSQCKPCNVAHCLAYQSPPPLEGSPCFCTDCEVGWYADEFGTVRGDRGPSASAGGACCGLVRGAAAARKLAPCLPWHAPERVAAPPLVPSVQCTDCGVENCVEYEGCCQCKQCAEGSKLNATTGNVRRRASCKPGFTHCAACWAPLVLAARLLLRLGRLPSSRISPTVPPALQCDPSCGIINCLTYSTTGCSCDVCIPGYSPTLNGTRVSRFAARVPWLPACCCRCRCGQLAAALCAQPAPCCMPAPCCSARRAASRAAPTTCRAAARATSACPANGPTWLATRWGSCRKLLTARLACLVQHGLF